MFAFFSYIVKVNLDILHNRITVWESDEYPGQLDVERPADAAQVLGQPGQGEAEEGEVCTTARLDLGGGLVHQPRTQVRTWEGDWYINPELGWGPGRGTGTWTQNSGGLSQCLFVLLDKFRAEFLMANRIFSSQF